MHYGIEVVNLGTFADPCVVMRLAQAAEGAGWEGLFVWDYLGYVWNAPTDDPWILLTAVATVTQKLLLGTAVSPFACQCSINGVANAGWVNASIFRCRE